MGRHYDYPDLPSKPDVIVDLGANIGLSLALFSERYPEARIYGFEPAPDHFEILQLNIAARPNVKPFGLLLCHRMVALA